MAVDLPRAAARGGGDGPGRDADDDRVPLHAHEGARRADEARRWRRIHFVGATDVLRFCVGNVVSKQDARGNDYPRKERPESKIDAVTALLLALGRALVAPPPAGTDFVVV